MQISSSCYADFNCGGLRWPINPYMKSFSSELAEILNRDGVRQIQTLMIMSRIKVGDAVVGRYVEQAKDICNGCVWGTLEWMANDWEVPIQ